jgi:prolyl oligopeptidase
VPAAGGVPAEVDLPIDGTIGGWAALPDPAGLLLDLESYTSPPRRYRYDAGSGTVTGGPDDAGRDAGHTGGGDCGLFAGITAYRALAPARDGTPIPISLIHRDGLVRDGTAPVWLEGYGSHGVPLTPEHEPARLAWLRRGGIWAIAHLRGGGEYGRDWHEAGRLSAKENTITDFIDCAEHLIAQGYTQAGRLVGAGRSAGGIPVAGALVRRPDLWAAMILRVPVVNSLRIEFAENGRLHTPEYGTVGTEDGLRGLLTSDACHRVRDGIAYPPVLLTAGRNDSRVPPWQPGKLAARLQAAEENGTGTGRGGPALLRVDEHAGHGFGSTTEQQDEELADAFAFALAAISGRLGRVAAANG